MKKFLLLLAMACLLGGVARAEGKPVDFWLTILHNNDGESNLVNLGAGLEDFGGADRFKTRADELKFMATRGPRSALVEELGGKRGVVLLSSGDNFLAGPEFNASISNGVPFYDTIALDLIGYDAICLGNHDFDFGPDVLADFIEGFEPPVPYLSANLDFSAEPRLQALVEQGVLSGSTVIKERGELIGVIGATTPNLGFISSPRNVVVNADIAPIIQAEVDKLEAAGVNKIILISHLQGISEDRDLAAATEGIDVIIAGGGDELLANPGDLLVPNGTPVFGPYPLTATDANGTTIPVVTTQGSYGYIGKLVVGFDKAGKVVLLDAEESGPVRVAGGYQVDSVASDETVFQQVVLPVVEALESLEANVIATSEVPLDGLRSSVRRVETNQGNLIADAFLWQARELAADFGVAPADVAFGNGGGIRNDTVIPAGPLTELDTFDMLPFSNFITVLEGVSREDFKNVLENAVSRTQPADSDSGTGRFAQVAGFRYTYTGAGTAIDFDGNGNVTVPGTRVQDVVLDDGTVIVSGGAVVPGPALTVATVNFLATGGDEYPLGGLPFTLLGATYQQALANYLVNGLGGVVSAAQYPEGGEGRITELP